MAGQVTEMEIPVVRGMAKRFGTISDVLKTVSKTLEAIGNGLKFLSFIGVVGAAMAIHFIETIRPPIDQLSQKCSELSGDLGASVEAFARGDAEGKTKFY